MTLKQKLEQYITSEIADSALYTALAELAKTSISKQVLLQIASEEAGHAKAFGEVYKSAYGAEFVADKPTQILPKEDYNEIIRDRILDEIEDYRKYNKDATMPESEALKRIYAKNSIDENTHAVKLLDILGGL
ncbi:MAG: ferritin-like domain-containing protein [Firmicutes bacterium]|nr:ferritin-like domain-containing protein [Bacillota bacterium]